MGVHKNISHDKFPKQTDWVGKRTKVIFHYQNPELYGTIVRDDEEEPRRTIIQLDDGRFILATECQYSPQ